MGNENENSVDAGMFERLKDVKKGTILPVKEMNIKRSAYSDSFRKTNAFFVRTVALANACPYNGNTHHAPFINKKACANVATCTNQRNTP